MVLIYRGQLEEKKPEDETKKHSESSRHKKVNIGGGVDQLKMDIDGKMYSIIT